VVSSLARDAMEQRWNVGCVRAWRGRVELGPSSSETKRGERLVDAAARAKVASQRNNILPHTHLALNPSTVY
jgi:hypothetical protein